MTIRDNGTPQQSSTTRVVVKVTDENDNAPEFIEKLYRVPLPEMPSASFDEPLLRLVGDNKIQWTRAIIRYSGRGRY